MKKMILVAALALPAPLIAPTWAQAPEQKSAAPKSVEASKPAPKAAKSMRKASAKRHQDARHCLQRTSNDAIIRCAEEYL